MIGFWISFGLILLFDLCLTIFFVYKFKDLKERKLVYYLTFLFLLLDLFYMSCFALDIIWRFIFGSFTLAFLFIHIIMVITNNKSNSKTNVSLMIIDFVISIVCITYLLYIIPTLSLKDILIPIFASLLGGSLTLLGVLITIKKSDKDRKDEEVKKAKPVLFVMGYKEIDHIVHNTKFLKSKKSYGTLKPAPKDSKKKYSLQQIFLFNSDYSHSSLIGFMINEDFHFYDYGQVLAKNTEYSLVSCFEFEYAKEIKSVSLIFADMLDNYYGLELNFETSNSGKILINSGIEWFPIEHNKEKTYGYK